MKKLVIALVCGLLLVPISAWGQKWIEPYTARDGTRVEGHWQTQEEIRQKSYSTPGQINPYTGQFNPFTNRLNEPQTINPTPRPYDPLNPQPYQPNYKYRGW